MITIRSYILFQPSAARTSSRFRPNPAINRWAIFNRPRNADSAEPILWATPIRRLHRLHRTDERELAAKKAQEAQEVSLDLLLCLCASLWLLLNLRNLWTFLHSLPQT